MTATPWDAGLAEDPVAPATSARAAAFHALYEAEYDNIAGYCYLLVRDHDLARDLAQEAFARLLSRWVAVREPRPFLFRVVTNLARDAWRRDKRARAAYTVLAADRSEVATGADAGVRDAVARLPQPHRAAVELYYYADLPVPEVAAVLRRPVGTTKRLLSEARAMLATALEDGRA